MQHDFILRILLYHIELKVEKMKRLICLSLSVLLLLSAICFPVQVHAAQMKSGTKIYTGDEVLALACQIWPEKAGKLTTPSATLAITSQYTAETQSAIVEKKIHQIDENTSIQYVEYSSGYALAAIGSWYEDSKIQGSNHETVHGNVTVASGMHVSYLINFCYTIDYDANDYLTETWRFDNSNAAVYDIGLNKVQTTSTNAYYSYSVSFTDSLGNYYGGAIVWLGIVDDEFACDIS